MLRLKGQRTLLQVNNSPKKARVAILVSDGIDFTLKNSETETGISK